MTEDTYRYTGPKPLRRSAARDGPDMVEHGETFRPDEVELNAFGDQLERVEQNSTDDKDEAAAGPAETGADEADESADESDVDAILAEHVEDPDDYTALSELADEVEGVPSAGLSTDDLKERLAEALAE